jgi:hypothetical protein
MMPFIGGSVEILHSNEKRNLRGANYIQLDTIPLGNTFFSMQSEPLWEAAWVQAISRWVDHHSITLAIVAGAIIPLLVPRAWNLASERFEEKRKRLLLAVAILMILAIPFVFYWLRH